MIETGTAPRVRLTSVRLPKAAEVLATQIKSEIISGKYPVGAMLPSETEMALQLTVSRPTVREALRLLESEGLVSIRPGPRGGPRVERPSSMTVTRSLTTLFQYERVSLAELLEARRAIEPACARVAATRATADDIAALRRSIEAMRANLNDVAVFWRENANFHVALAEAGGNTVLNTLMVSLRELIYDFTAGMRIAPDERLETVAEHTAITKAIAANDPDAAARAAEAHLASFEVRLKEVWHDLDAVRLNGTGSRGSGKMGGGIVAGLNEFLAITQTTGGQKVIRCTRCEYDLCAATENHKLHALLQEGPVQEAGPHVNPYHLGGDKFVFRQFYCPNCLALINTEVALRGEPILWDVELKV